ncbi:unnamed protein product [Ilex paraguariensis]|uniref:Uncharacterized protein n=1 Tax=Ilex paraguariensis TaxID=185542 RepID=A0ABC8TTT6_9AQUA
MLGFAAASTTVAVVGANTVYRVHSSVSCTALHLHKASWCFQLFQSSTMSFRLESIKAMAEVSETLVTPKSDSKPSASGSKQALISLSDKRDLSLLGNGLQELG